ncbi:MAG TPA: LysE family translocator [Noviherbaspirillum sp.]|jgi:threonine/homoserine/homoserine lactone efflux protein|uniref:LysE family translocator n=1 Tax=Noviherbaspirillum sp. TaxID=1926288 RepID=UPI002F952208
MPVYAAQEAVLQLAVFALSAALSPGGATTLATASGARFGFRRSLPFVIGVAAGMASLTGTAALGLASVLLALPSMQLALKLLGSLYLVWLAWRIGSAGAPALDTGMARPIGFLGSLGLLWLNPKGWVVALGAAASFSSVAAGPWQLATLIAVAFGLAALLSMALWCYAGLVFARLLKTDLHWRLANGTLGLLLAGSVIQIWLE